MLKLNVKQSDDGQCLEIEVGGQLLYSEAERFKDTVLPHLKEQSKVKVDCSDLSFLDSAGMGSFVRLWKECKMIGADLEFHNVVEDVQSLLKIARLHQLTRIIAKS
jgi:anti-sigma B factor antagonist